LAGRRSERRRKGVHPEWKAKDNTRTGEEGALRGEQWNLGKKGRKPLALQREQRGVAEKIQVRTNYPLFPRK